MTKTFTAALVLEAAAAGQIDLEVAGNAGFEPDGLALLTAVPEAPREHEPGTTVAYTSASYLYLGLLLEYATGRDYADLVADLALRHDLDLARVDPGRRPGSAAGGIEASASDLAR